MSAGTPAKKPGRPRKSQVIPYTQTELFSASIAEWSLQDDLVSMEYPLFSLSKNPDLSIREYENPASKKKFRITPSVLGAATVFDKDLLLFIGSQIIEARRVGLPISQNVKVDTYSFLTGTNRNPGGKAYENVLDMLRRLKGTQLETNIETGGEEETSGFGWIEDYKITKYTSKGSGVLECEVTLSNWLYKGLINNETLTIDHRYFALTQPLERRLYELARKHAGSKAIWKADIDMMHVKSGTTQSLRHFRSDVRKVIERDGLPDFHLALDTSVKPQMLVFYTRDRRALGDELRRHSLNEWFAALELPPLAHGESSYFTDILRLGEG